MLYRVSLSVTNFLLRKLFGEMEIKTRTKPWAHQVKAFHMAYPEPGFGIFFGPAAGKTKLAIDLVVNRGDKKVLIVVPHQVLEDEVWEKQIPMHGKFDDGVVIKSMVDGTSVEKSRQLLDIRLPNPNATLFVVVNYESVWRGTLGEHIAKIKWDCVILDEAHHIKAAGSRVSMYMGRLGPKVKHRLALTATPTAHSPLDAYGLFRFIDPTIFGTRFDAFKNRYANFGGKSGYQVLSYKELDDLRQKMATKSYHVSTRDVVDLPPEMHVVHTASMDPKMRAVYKAMEKEMVANFKDGSSISVKNGLTKVLRLQQIASGLIVLDDGTEVKIRTPKTDLLREVLDGMPTIIHSSNRMNREPVVVFCHFRHEIESVREVAEQCRYRWGELSGKADHLQTWRNGEVDLLIVQQQSGSEGIDLTHSRYAIYYSKMHSLGLYIQSMGRINRPEQKHPTCFIHLRVAGTIEVDIDRALEERRDVIEYIMQVYRSRR